MVSDLLAANGRCYEKHLLSGRRSSFCPSPSHLRYKSWPIVEEPDAKDKTIWSLAIHRALDIGINSVNQGKLLARSDGFRLPSYTQHGVFPRSKIQFMNGQGSVPGRDGRSSNHIGAQHASTYIFGARILLHFQMMHDHVQYSR